MSHTAIAAVLVAAFVLCATSSAVAKQHRSNHAKTEFRHAHHCPATGSGRGACHGYVIDHITPLCAGGTDAAHNMQWQTTADAKIKDRSERRQCRRSR